MASFGFGSSNANTGSAFSFGGNTNTTNANSGNSAFSLGGNTTNTNTTSQTTPAFSFGQSSQPQTSGTSLFGQPAQQNQQQSSGTSLFGQPSQPAAGASGTSLFGRSQIGTNTSATNTTGPLFGQPQTNTAPAAGSLFGQPSQQQQPQQQGLGTTGSTPSLFGKPATTTTTGTSLFGGAGNTQAQPNTTPSLFGGNKPTTGGLFNPTTSNTAPAGSLFGQPQGNNTPLFGQPQQQQQQQPQNSQFNPDQRPARRRPNNELSTLEQIEKLQRAWDPSSPSCAFQFFFYNRVGQQEALLYERPVRIEQSRWDNAIAERPDDTHVPALAIGFTDLQKRVAVQETAVTQYRKRMHEIDEKLAVLSQRHDLQTTVKIDQMKMRHRKLVHRTLALAARIQVLRSRGYVLRPDEEVLKRKLEQLHKEVDDPAVFGRINEIWARLTVLRERAKSISTGHGVELNELVGGDIAAGLEGTGAAGEKVRAILSELDWNRDDEQLEKLAKVLKAQQVGISYLAEILLRDTAQVENIIDELTYRNEKSDEHKRLEKK